MPATDYITHEEIRQRAHGKWEQAGRPHGHEEAHWLEAETELRRERDAATDADEETAPRGKPSA